MSIKTATIKKIAEKAGVSIGTVDRVLHNRSDVSEATRAKVLSIVKEFGYQPNVYASNLVRNKGFHFAYIIPNATYTAYWEAPVKGFSSAVKELQVFGISSTGYYFDQTDENSFKRKCKEALEEGYDGIVLAPFFIESANAFILECRNANIPVVLIDSYINESQCLAYFGQDPYQSGLVAGKLLSLSAGQSSNITIVNVQKKDESNRLFERRIEGFKAYFEANRSDIVLFYITGNETAKSSAYTILRKHLDIINKSSGLFIPHSKADVVGDFLEKENIKNKRLVTFDLTPNNIAFLEKDLITFIINQRPEEQAYKAIYTLHEVVVLKQTILASHLFPIEILTKENYGYYVSLWKEK